MVHAYSIRIDKFDNILTATCPYNFHADRSFSMRYALNFAIVKIWQTDISNEGIVGHLSLDRNDER